MAKNTVNISKNVGQVVVTWIKDGVKATYCNVKNGVSTMYEQTTSKVVQTSKTVAVISYVMCRAVGACKLPDYLYCSASNGRGRVRTAVNLWNGQSYLVLDKDETYIPKQIYKGVTNKADDINKLSKQVGGQCSLGYIYNGEGSPKTYTDAFFVGGGVTHCECKRRNYKTHKQ